MRCLLCQNLSFSHICKNCQKEFLKPQITKREIFRDFYVVSFYKYSEIEHLLKTKHTFIGSFIYKILAKNSMKIFLKEFYQKAYLLPIDTRVKDYYSHTAILAKYSKSKNHKPLYNSLMSQNSVTYSGKSYEYRLKNPRDFIYLGPGGIDVILIDDIVTTGLTLKEAYFKIKQKANVLFALTLADARE